MAKVQAIFEKSRQYRQLHDTKTRLESLRDALAKDDARLHITYGTKSRVELELSPEIVNVIKQELVTLVDNKVNSINFMMESVDIDEATSR